MNKTLFSNPGKKIKTLSVILFWLVVVSSFICAFTFGWVKRYDYYSSSRVFVPEIFFAFLLGGPIGAYISSLFLYGFGELVENSQSSSFNLEKLIDKLIPNNEEDNEEIFNEGTEEDEKNEE